MKKKKKPLKYMVRIKPHHIQFLELCKTDATYGEMATEMQKPVRTIECYRDRLFKHFEVRSRTPLVLAAIKNKLIKL